MTTVATNHEFGFAISDKITEEVQKLDVWSVFSPASGQSSRATGVELFIKWRIDSIWFE